MISKLKLELNILLKYVNDLRNIIRENGEKDPQFKDKLKKIENFQEKKERACDEDFFLPEETRKNQKNDGNTVFIKDFLFFNNYIKLLKPIKVLILI